MSSASKYRKVILLDRYSNAYLMQSSFEFAKFWLPDVGLSVHFWRITWNRTRYGRKRKFQNFHIFGSSLSRYGSFHREYIAIHLF